MVKKGRSKTETATEKTMDGTKPISVRFANAAYERLVEAAKIRGWTVTHLLRVATTEKAAHILNTSDPQIDFEFGPMAQRVAENLFKQRDFSKEEHDGHRPYFYACDEEFYSDGDDPPKYRIDPPMTLREDVYDGPNVTDQNLAKLEKAAELGGVEFLNMVIDFCKALCLSRPAGKKPLNPKDLLALEDSDG